MNFIYENLSKHAPTFYEDMVRKSDGSIDIRGTNIVYNVEGMLQLTDNKVRKDIPITIDIWHLSKDLHEIYELMYAIDKDIDGYIFRSDDIVFRIVRDNNYILNVPDDSEEIRRKRMSYIIKYYRH